MPYCVTLASLDAFFWLETGIVNMVFLAKAIALLEL